MVGSISSQGMMPPPPSGGNSSQNSLTSSQQDTISSTLEQFDASNLTAKDAQSIVEAFSAAGIQPSKELASAMEELGFDAKEVGDLAGVGGPQGGMPPPPPPPSDEEFDSVSSLLDTLFNSQDEEDSTSTASFDEILDYTSRILNLNEQSKTDVMELLGDYSQQSSDYTQEEQATLLKSSLGSILSDSDNYRSVSFYA